MVREVNQAPVLDPVGNKSVNELEPLTFTATATDLDIPANSLTFSLEDAPDGAAIDPDTGVFTWTPGVPGVYPFTVRVCDNGTPPSCDAEEITVTVRPDLIFADGFESEGLKWTSAANVSHLSMTTQAKLVGEKGLQVLVDNRVAAYVTDDSPDAETHYLARFYFDPNSISMAERDTHILFAGYQGTATTVLVVEFRFYNGSYQLRSYTWDDAVSPHITSWVTINDASHFIELDWQAAANGSLSIWIDGIKRSELTGIDNHMRAIDRVRLGAVGGLDAGTSGTYFFDAFKSVRQFYIGPENGVE